MIVTSLALIYLGIFLVFVGFMLFALRRKGNSEGGAIIMIGPIPIVIASNPRIARTLLIIGAILFVIIILMMVI